MRTPTTTRPTLRLLVFPPPLEPCALDATFCDKLQRLVRERPFVARVIEKLVDQALHTRPRPDRGNTLADKLDRIARLAPVELLGIELLADDILRHAVADANAAR